jgi:gamma-glutamyltranspeptidase / glutathione hydrolase
MLTLDNVDTASGTSGRCKMARSGAIRRYAVLLLFFLLFSPCHCEAKSRLVESGQGMVASAHPLASEVGVEILKKGGNAVDAAVAAAFAIAVVEPHASSLGGGGFMLIYLSERKRLIAIDHRETAPSGSGATAFTSEGYRSVAVPGTPAGLALALEKYGTMKLSDVVEPAARLAENGFSVDQTLSSMMSRYTAKLSRAPAARAAFLKNGRAYKVGERLRQKELAKTLRLIGGKGVDVFYRGEIAEALVDEMKKAGNWITKKDIETYRALEKEPVTGDYRGYKIVSMPPPSSGLLIVELLNIVEGWDLSKIGHNSPQAIQLLAEAMRRAYVDRARFLGDPSFVKMPLSSLTSKEYAARLRKDIEKGKASQSIRRIDPRKTESDRTTHISVVDNKGNAVSHTQTVGNFFGSGIAIPGTGILLNNQMSDFAASGKKPNAVAPGKRSVSSISPTIVLKGDKPYLVVGGAGAMRIVSSLSQIIINMIDYGMDVNEAISSARIHAQSRTVTVESRIPAKTLKALRGMGYRVEVRRDYDLFLGGAQGITIDPKTGRLQGAADPRRRGEVAAY